MRISREEYKKLCAEKSRKSPLVRDMIIAFAVGGGICVGGQLLFELAKYLGASETDAGTAVSVTIIFIAALLTGLGVFDSIAKRAGAGTFVPISGFANSIAAPAMEFKNEGMVLGMAAKMFVVAGPVLVYGISSGVVYGIILWIMQRAGV